MEPNQQEPPPEERQPAEPTQSRIGGCVFTVTIIIGVLLVVVAILAFLGLALIGS